MSRSRGIVIVSELEAALALCCSALGPRLACTYIERPLLLDGHKFDCRMYVAVRSLAPPRAFLYRHWYARVCSQPYASAPLSEHLAHLTVQKYAGVAQEFVEQQDLLRRLAAAGGAGGARFDWAQLVRPRLLHAIANVIALLIERADGSQWSGGRCRALYGVDVLFAESSAWQQRGGDAQPARARQDADAAAAPHDLAAQGDVQPVVLEMNYSPDYAKMLEMRPQFLNDAFAMLFLDEAGEEGLWERLPLH